MNNINEDLEFNADISGEFDNGRIPTLDFELWIEEDGSLNHNYFQKSIRTPYVTMQRSAMSNHQKMAIMSNEMIRRLSNINHKKNREDRDMLSSGAINKRIKSVRL